MNLSFQKIALIMLIVYTLNAKIPSVDILLPLIVSMSMLSSNSNISHILTSTNVVQNAAGVYNNNQVIASTDMSSSYINPYNNAMVGMSDMQLDKLHKSKISDPVAELTALDKARMNANLSEVDMYSQTFMQMPDQSLHNFRGIVFTDDDILPNNNLVLEMDFYGARASNLGGQQTLAT